MKTISYDWLKETNYQDNLTGDCAFIADCCGIDILIALLDSGMAKTTLRISENHLKLTRKEYIKNNFNGENVKELARKLHVTEQFVYDSLSEKY